jgi:hypothetical protein
MAAIGNACFWFVDFEKSSLKLLGIENFINVITVT